MRAGSVHCVYKERDCVSSPVQNVKQFPINPGEEVIITVIIRSKVSDAAENNKALVIERAAKCPRLLAVKAYMHFYCWRTQQRQQMETNCYCSLKDYYCYYNKTSYI